MKAIEELFDALVRAEKTERDAVGVTEFEAEFVSVLNLIKANKELRPKIVHEFSKWLKDQSRGPYTLIEFCMHDLRWEELCVEVEQILKSCNEDVAQGKMFGKPLQHVMQLQSVISSFDDAWENSDLYSYYKTKV